MDRHHVIIIVVGVVAVLAASFLFLNQSRDVYEARTEPVAQASDVCVEAVEQGFVMNQHTADVFRGMADFFRALDSGNASVALGQVDSMTADIQRATPQIEEFNRLADECLLAAQ